MHMQIFSYGKTCFIFSSYFVLLEVLSRNLPKQTLNLLLVFLIFVYNISYSTCVLVLKNVVITVLVYQCNLVIHFFSNGINIDMLMQSWYQVTDTWLQTCFSKNGYCMFEVVEREWGGEQSFPPKYQSFPQWNTLRI